MSLSQANQVSLTIIPLYSEHITHVIRLRVFANGKPNNAIDRHSKGLLWKMSQVRLYPKFVSGSTQMIRQKVTCNPETNYF